MKRSRFANDWALGCYTFNIICQFINVFVVGVRLKSESGFDQVFTNTLDHDMHDL